MQPLAARHVRSVGLVRDAALGPLVRLAAGAGDPPEWDDEVLLLPPVGRHDAARAVRALQLWPSWSATAAWRRST